MKTGTARIDITPEVGVELSGYVARVQPSIDVHDALLARCLYLEEGDQRLLWVHTDLVGLEREFVVGLKSEMRERFGLAPEEVVVSATHTHSGPATVHLINCGEYESKYVEGLHLRLLDAAARALEQTVDTRVVAAEGLCELSIDRRGKATAHTDHRVGTLGWRRADGAYVAALANYAMHNVGLGSDNRIISGDIFGSAAAAAERRLPGSPTVLFTNGACGNTNPPKHVTDFAQIDAWGDLLASSATDALDASGPVDKCVLRAAAETVEVPLDTPDAARIDASADYLRGSVQGHTGYVPDRARQTADAWQQRMRGRLERGTLPTHAEMVIQAVRIGPLTLVCLGAEVFSMMADELRQATGRTLYVVGYANGDIGYLPTSAAYAEGGYEVDCAFMYYGSLRPRMGAFEMVRDKAVELVKKL